MLFNTPTTGQVQILATAGVFLAISWITLGLRFWVRFVVIKNPGWDDAALLFTAVCEATTMFRADTDVLSPS